MVGFFFSDIIPRKAKKEERFLDYGDGAKFEEQRTKKEERRREERGCGGEGSATYLAFGGRRISWVDESTVTVRVISTPG